MSTIDNNTITTSTGETINIVNTEDTGFNGLEAEDFLQMLITQLQNQDPTEPFSQEEMLSQIAQMRSLESDLELTDALSALTSSQSAFTSATFTSTAAALIGRTITATVGEEGSETELSGEVERALLQDGSAFVVVNGEQVSIDSITTVE